MQLEVTSKMNPILSDGTKLPSIVVGPSYLVSPVLTPTSCSPHDLAASWALELRNRINKNIECHENVNEDDIMTLKKELITVFISTLQQDSHFQWSVFVEILCLLEHYREFFDTKAEFDHYLERILHHANLHKERLFDLQIETSLAKIFPEHVRQLKSRGPTLHKNYCSITLPTHSISSPSTTRVYTQKELKLNVYPSMHLPDGTDPYSNHVVTDVEICGAKQLTVRDLNKSMGAVALEMAAREAVWSHPLGTTALALATKLSEEEGKESEQLTFDARSNVRKSLPSVRLSYRKDQTPRSAPKMEEEVLLMTGREAVQFFASCHHMGQIKSLYLNLAPSQHYSPYDLISVPKNKANPEHYVFSTFGVLHVYPDQSSECMTLAEWQREAVLWKAVSSISFFKNFLMAKAFYRWSANRQYTEFQKQQRRIFRNLLHAMPPFGAALLKIASLLKELLTVSFLPTEIDKTYQLGEYENGVHYKNIQAEKFLDRFFKYCKLIVEFTADKAFKKLHHCEKQVTKKTVFSKDSLFLQRMKKQERENNLKNARRETAFLGNFVKLVDQMIVEHMFEITKTQIIRFVHAVIGIGSDAPREGFFKANFVFNKHGVLGLSPSKKHFQKVLNNTLRGIPSVLLSKAIAIDRCVREKDSQEENAVTRSETDKHPDNQHIVSLNTAQTNINAKNGDTGSHMSSIKQSSHQTLSTLSEQALQCTENHPSAKVAEHDTLANLVNRSTNSDLPLLDLPRQEPLSKEEDYLGVATPDLVLRHISEYPLRVEGEGFMGQYSPLSKANLDDKLLKDQEYQAALMQQEEIMSAGLEEIEHYCEFNQWLNEIHQYCLKWNEKSVKEFKGAAAFVIEQKLTELRQWSDKVRNFDNNYVTENGMFYIDCSAIHKGLLPRLSDIYQELITFVADEARTLAQTFVEETNIILKNMTNKSSEVSSFASFAKNFNHYKKNTVQFQYRVEYTKSLYEVIRMSHRQLTLEEEKFEERVCSSWELLQMQMQDASEFVSTQTPLMTQQLQETFQRLSKEAALQAELATTGKFLDPNENPHKILAEMKEIREKFFNSQVQLQQASQWHEAIHGEPYSLKFLNEMTVKMDVRQELWKYVEVSTYTIKDWKQMLFKKIGLKKALEKVIEWQSAASQLKPLLPLGDSVLTTWCQQLQNFSKDLPLLHKLANDALRERHWHAIFLGLNEPYDPNHQFTVAELMSYNLSDHADLINATYMSAVAEYDLEQHLSHIIQFWQNYQFKLAKHIPDRLFIKEPSKRNTSVSKKPSKLERYRQERAAVLAGTQKGLDLASDDFYVLIDLEELKYHLEDSRISVNAMMPSPYVVDIKDQVMYWCEALREIEEITDLWVECQKKWLYLLKIFEQPNLYHKFSQQAFKFEAVHNKFKDWMRVVSNDSKCVSVVNHRRGDKGYRLLQGDNLKSLLRSLIQEQEEILKDLEMYTENCRGNFPRLYFLSNVEIIDLLGISRNPQALIPYVRKCFPNVHNMTFALPPGISRHTSHLDYALNSEKLEAVSIQGAWGEELPLYTHVESILSSTRWLHNVNDILKNTILITTRACVQARIEEGTRQPILILEELARLSTKQPTSKSMKMSDEIKSTFHHWLLRFPVQCVIIAEAIMWEQGMTRVLQKQDKDELQQLSLSSKLDQLVHLLQETQTRKHISDNNRHRLKLLISGLLNQSIYHRDVMDNLIKTNQVTDAAFDWLKIMKFKMDIRNVLRAKTVITDNTSTMTNANGSKALNRSHVLKGKNDTKVLDETPKLTRTLTTVSTDYQFSTCYVQQLGNLYSYDYEYLGPSRHLVITPLTERAFLAMGHALRTFHCGTMIGPNGTGKTETVRELSRLLGRCIFTISCHESITVTLMLQYMTGMIQSGCWALFDDTDRLTKGVMSVAAQQLDYLRTALRTLDVNSENQYLIRGHSHFDKKTGMGDKLIRRNSLTTLHPLPKAEAQPTPLLERQRTVPHGFNEKGLVTYFEDTWVAERDQRRHSIEREIEIKESELYKSRKPPSLFYEHVKANKRRSAPDYSKLNAETSYVHRMLGNVMFDGRLIQASSNFGCFMTINAKNPASADIPYDFRILMRPCALIIPDIDQIISVTLESYGFQCYKMWAKKLMLFFKLLETQMNKGQQYKSFLKEVKKAIPLAAAKKRDSHFLHKISGDSIDKQGIASKAEDNSKAAEEHSLVFSLKEILIPRHETEAETRKFVNILREVFPLAASEQANSRYSSYSQWMITAITEVFKEDRMESNDIMFDKILQLHSALETHTPVILAGRSGSGKTKMYHTLARAINLLNYKLYAPDHSKDELTTERDMLFHAKQKLKLLKDMDEHLKPEPSVGIQKLHKMKMLKTAQTADEGVKKSQDYAEYPKIDVIHLFPGAMTPLELLGTFENGMWQGGLLRKFVKDSYFIWLATKSFIENQKHQDKKNVRVLSGLPSVLKRWLVLDGELDPLWTEGMKTLLDDEQRLSLANGESILLADTTSVIFETADLRSSSPSSISRCSVLYCGPGTTTWSALYYTWKQNATTRWLLTSDGMKILDELINDVFPSTVKFITSECQTALLTDVGRETATANQMTSGVSEVSTFLHIFTAILDRSLKREDVEKKMTPHIVQELIAENQESQKGESHAPPSRLMGNQVTNTSQIETGISNYTEKLKGMFAFSYIWAFGGHLHDRFKEKFSKFAHDAMYRARHSVQLPMCGLVFDYYLDEHTATFAKYSDKQLQDRIKNLAGFLVTPEVDRYLYLLELLMASHHPILLAGAPGVGKSALIQSTVLTKCSSTTVIMSPGLNSSLLQNRLMSHILDLQSKSNAAVAISGANSNNQTKQRHLFFIDDINMAPIVGGYQPPLELIRSILTEGGMYERSRQEFQKTEEADFIAAATLPTVPGTGLGKACHVMSSRVTRRFVNLTVFTPTDDALRTLFSQPLQTWLEEFPMYSVVHHFEFAQAMSYALLELYQCVKERLRPCPSQPHYIFSLHDLYKVVQGIMLMSPRTRIKKVKAKKKGEGSCASAPVMRVIARLWCHEVSRAFGDRIIVTEDQAWFRETVEKQVVKHFCSPKISQEMTAISKEFPQHPTRARSASVQSKEQVFPLHNLDSEETKSFEQEEFKQDGNKLSLPSETDHGESIIGTTSCLPTSSKEDVSTQLSHAQTGLGLAVTGATSDQMGIRENNMMTSGSVVNDEGSSQLDKSLMFSTVERETDLECDGETEVGDKTSSKTVSSDDLNILDSPDSSSKTSECSTSDIFTSFSANGNMPQVKGQGSPINKHSVTFKAGLIADKEHETYYGPLLFIDEIKDGNKALTDFIFSKYYMAHHAEMQGLTVDNGYTENGEVLAEALHTCLKKYNESTSQRLRLVFFSEAVCHAARLSRVLAQPKGHALLLGMSNCTGRATLARLAAFVAHCKLYQPKPQSLHMHNLNVMRKYIKLSCFNAGISGKPTVLLVHEDMGEEVLQDVSAIMAEGTFSGLYTEQEIQDIVSHIMPGGVQTKRVDKIEQAFDRFVKRIRKNLHVIVCLNYQGNSFSTNFLSLQNKLQQHPALLKNCFSIDVYHPWSFKAISQVAQTWLEDTQSGVTVPWSPSHRAEQIEMSSNAMAYIHLSARASVEREFCHQQESMIIFTPLTFIDFIHVFKIVSAFLVHTERAKGAKFEQVLAKIDEAFGSIAEYKKEVSDLMPQSNDAGGKIKDLVTQVEKLKQEYRQALDRCKAQEETILKLQGPLEKLRQFAQIEFDKVNPKYQAAAEVLDNLDHSAFEELKSYPSPPQGVVFVMNAVCLLFRKTQTWESAKSMMANANFFQELIFYDKDNIPEDIFKELKDFVNHPIFTPETLASVSSAASSICAWVRAVFMYSTIRRKMQPHLKNLQDAENKFTKAQAQLGHLRVESHQIKTNLEQHISQHKEAMKVSNAIEKKIQAIERKIARANNLMENMSVQHFLWRSELKKTRKHIASAPGDALITAACVVYHGPLDDKSRLDLMHEWLDRIKQNAFNGQAYMNREPYSVTTHLDLLINAELQQASGCQYSGNSNEASHGEEKYNSKVCSKLPPHPQVKTFKYMSAVYDSSKYYKSELKKQDTLESLAPDESFMDDLDDDDDDDANSILPTRPNLTVLDILSDFDELSEWRMQGLPADLHSVQNALIMRMCCHNRKHCWPLLIDPDNQAEMWVRALQTNQNIFTEKDVAEFVADDAIPIKEGSLQKSNKVPECPPSRSTILTFLDVTEYTFTDTQSQYTSDSQILTSDELQPITSATTIWGSYSLHAETGVDTNLWVLEADDPNINSKLINAVVQGVTVLITQLECKPLHPIFRGLLLKQFYVDKEGNKIVKIGDMIFNYHPNFCLYLSSTVPLFVKGDGLHSFPLHQLCVINMAVSDEAIINRLMVETMKVEKKEFEGQKRSNENDIILHRQQLAKEHEIIREKTLNLNGPLLEDKTMLDSLIMCQTNVKHNRQILEETRYMGNHLEEKFAHYTPFIKHSAMLYNILRKMSVFYPCYYFPFHKYVEMFTSVIKSRDRGKGSLGAPQVRAQELSDAVLRTVFKYAGLMMFEQHYNLLSLLVVVERMMRQRKASSKELSLFVNGFQKQELDDSGLVEQKPQWVDASAWIDCSILECLHHPFHGLRLSLVNNSQQWKEYFQHPIALLNPVPGTTLQELSLFQKCLLWKFVCPKKMAELSQAMILYELGSAVDPPDNYNIHEVYTYTDRHTPTVFILPSQEKGSNSDGTVGYPFVSPAHEVKRLAKDISMEGKLRILNFGVASQMTEVRHALEDCLQTGHWLLLQNYHLAKEPDPQFFSMIKDIISTRWMDEDNRAERIVNHDGERSLVSRFYTFSHVSKIKIHPSFRLWITTRADGKRVMPGLLIQHGLRVTCEATANFRSLLCKSYKTTAFLMSSQATNDEQLSQRFNRVMPLALLHAIILHQSYFGRHAFIHQQFWTLADLSTAVDIFLNLTARTRDAETISDLVSHVYTQHCQDLCDVCAVQAIVKDLVMSATKVNKILTDEIKGVVQLLTHLSVAIKETGHLQRALNSIEDLSARTFCLPQEVQEHFVECKSKILQKELIQSIGAPEMSTQDAGGLPSQATTVLPSLLTMLASCCPLPETSVHIMPLDAFFNEEVRGYRELLRIVQNDLNILYQAAHGEISLTDKMSALLEDVSNDDVPAAWLEYTFATCSSLKVWLSELPMRMEYVKNCLTQCPAVLSLNMFLRPDRLFRAIIQMYAQTSFNDITDVSLDFQVMSDGQFAFKLPDKGVFIDGLQLKNASWDKVHSVLSVNTSCLHLQDTFPVLWVKPTVKDSSTMEAENKYYLCPLYSARHSDLQCDSNVVWTIPLPTLESHNLLTQKRTALTLTSVRT